MPQSLAGDAALTRWFIRAGVLWAGFALFFTRAARLMDADSYLHLALARTLAAHGFVDRLGWARFSVLGETYGDKELLFHVWLVPFVKLFDAELGGKLALAGLCSAIALSLWQLARMALAGVGWFVPVLVFGSGSFMLRALRLRPELLSLAILLWIVWAFAERRYRTAALLCCAFTLSHTAFHTVIVLALMFAAWSYLAERRCEWQLMASAAVGCAVGVLVHPQFPNNLRIFWVQNVEFFRRRAELDVGGEFQPHTTLDLLQLDVWFWLGLALLVVARKAHSSAPGPRRMAAFCWIAAASFGLLFAQMGRFSTLFMPFAALALCYELAARNFTSAPRSALLALLAAISCGNAGLTAFINWRMLGSLDPTLRTELDRLARKLPAGARVAANWDDAELYAYHAPHARYLNVLDPVFMAVAEPARLSTLRDVLAGELPDVPGAITGELDSEYLAFSGERPALLSRLTLDPRVSLLARGRHFLFHIRADVPPAFITDWRGKDGSTSSGRAYIDATRQLAADGCTLLEHTAEAGEPATRFYELAPWGPSTLFIDGQQRLQLGAASHARLGDGVAFPIQVDAEPHRWTVRTCGDEGRAGFYFVDRSQEH